MACACADPGIFVGEGGGGGGGPGQSDKKALKMFFFSPQLMTTLFFLSSAYFTEVKWLISKKTIFQGGPTFSRGGGVQLLIPYRNQYNL